MAEFYGHPVYFNGQYETTVIANNREPLFRQVTKQQYLEALIEDAERKQSSAESASHDENIKEMEKAYRPADKNNPAIQLIILRWKLSTAIDDSSAPRLFKSQKRSGYALVDQRMVELYHSAEIWKGIFNLVRQTDISFIGAIVEVVAYMALT